ncbi:SLAM family member 9-like [Colossoma macropomum]|uniref:SLAM family member 9-like n=1 Tax=Colossoma macropomum TaxID=42526 RepID=UPI0018645E16|nr:SLAM family member 9-like [Colossoma macropomum]XP_036411601.1 SLAM family member 9-like [Colossoma macropomum]
MMAMAAQMIFVFFSLVSITESSDVFRLVGDSVQLNIQDPVPEFDDLFWVFNRTENVLKYYSVKKTKQYPAYEGRVEFNEETYSLTLKNLQKTDSGLYEAKAVGAQYRVVAEYRVSVLDPVEAPVLTYHQLSNGTCIITLTCRGHDLSISSSCYNETCEEEEVTLPAGVNLSLFVNSSTIICNHSNPVSWKKVVLEMGELKRLCGDNGSKREETRGPDSGLTVPVVVGVVVFIILIAAFIVIYHYRKKSRAAIYLRGAQHE